MKRSTLVSLEAYQTAHSSSPDHSWSFVRQNRTRKRLPGSRHRVTNVVSVFGLYRPTSLIVCVCGSLVLLWVAALGIILRHHLQVENASFRFSFPSRINHRMILRGGSLRDSFADIHKYLLKETYNTKGDVSLPDAMENETIDMRQLSFTLPFINPDGGAWKQGWDVAPRQYGKEHEPITILVVPHSHCDPGWIKTFDEYFKQQTSSIITSVITSLLQDPKRTFIWAEISYFSWWWDEQNVEMKRNVKALLKSRQFEFVTGGWVQPDEANSELYAMEIQLREGHDWIREQLGDEFIPRYSWSIDPFGYSPSMAYLLKSYGFRGMLIQRVHYAVKKELAQRKHLEFYWRQTWSNNKSYDIFTHVMPFFSYDTPHTCGPDPKVCCQFDFHRAPVGNGPSCPWNVPPQVINDGNVAERSMLALDQYLKKASLYRGNVVLVPLGDDFRYQTTREATLQYENHQRIHDYINHHVDGVSIKFGTLSEYFDQTIGQFSPPVLKGSFFTYCDVNEDYWSGYFTSRVFDKALDRQLERVLFAATTLGANATELRDTRRALSLFQHHDGVTGTARDHVVADYAQRMHSAIQHTQSWMIARIRQRFPHESALVPDIKPCIVSSAPREISQNKCSKRFVMYNPLGSPQSCGVVTVPGRQARIGDLPCEKPGPVLDSITRFVFDPMTGLMIKPIREEWKVWQVSQGGAYLFIPGTLLSFNFSNVKVEEGGFVLTTTNWKRTVIEKRVPFEYGTTSTVIDFIFEVNLDRDNEEWIVRFGNDIDNHGISHTDLNGFNFDTHRFRSDMPIQSQVFPMPTLASIEDSKKRMTVMSEHAQGTAALQDGTIDVWLDRRLTYDDKRGLGQGVTDNRPTRTRLRILVESGKFDVDGEFRITQLNRYLWKELQHPLEMFGSHSQIMPPAISKKLDAASNQRHLNWKLRYAIETSNIPFVFMVHKRVDYMRNAINSLRHSDFPKERVPIIVSHDGRVPGMVDFINSIKSEFKIIQLFHPYACYDHPDAFPGNDTRLNAGFMGDSFGNPRTASNTCAKHHFTWLLKSVFNDLEMHRVNPSNVTHFYDTFLFLEEDYVVAPTIYAALLSGLNTIDQYENQTDGGFLGVGLDPAVSGTKYNPRALPSNSWWVDAFHSGPMTLNRKAFQQLMDHASEYCRFDDYNWDWSLVRLQTLRHMPHTLLLPSRILSRHIGLKGGMHSKEENSKLKTALGSNFEKLNEIKFVGTHLFGGNANAPRLKLHSGYGGWSHPADQEHCLRLLT